MKKLIGVLVIVMALVVLAGSVNAATVFTFTSDPGNWVGQGKSLSTENLNDFTIKMFTGYGNHIHMNLFWGDDFGIHDYDLFLQRKDGKMLEPGQYDATEFPFNNLKGTNGITFAGEARCSNWQVGNFRIHEIAYSTDGSIEKLAVDFEQYESTAYARYEPNYNAGLYGKLRWNSDYPLNNPVPIPGAVWLLGSGIVGVLGLRRKK